MTIRRNKGLERKDRRLQQRTPTPGGEFNGISPPLAGGRLHRKVNLGRAQPQRLKLATSGAGMPLKLATGWSRETLRGCSSEASRAVAGEGGCGPPTLGPQLSAGFRRNRVEPQWTGVGLGGKA